jgi:predicted dehydrogenase
MVALDERAHRQTLVGFNFILEPIRRLLKQRLLDGDFGRLLSAGFRATWPRSSRYFARAPWAGRLQDGEQLLLDSCFGNATAHFTHNLLFWCGRDGLDSWASPLAARAALYRAHPIQGADTFFVEAETSSGIPLRIAVTHLGSGRAGQRETIECEHCTIVHDSYGTTSIEWKDGRSEHLSREAFDPLLANYRDYVAYLRGNKPAPHTRLHDCEPFVTLNALSYLSSQCIHALPAARLRRVPETGGHAFIEADGLSEALSRFVADGSFPNFTGGEAGLRRWATPQDLAVLPALVRALGEAGVSGQA